MQVARPAIAQKGVIFISAFEITGTANFSQIMSALQTLQNSLNSVKAPTITPKVEFPNISSSVSQLTSQFNSANFGNVLGGFKGQLMKGVGDFGEVGKNLSTALTNGVSNGLSQFGMIGNVAGEVATALGPAGIALAATTVAVGALGIASIGAAKEWEAGLSKIAKTTGIEQGTEEFSKLESGLKNLMTTTPTTVAEIQSVATAAGSLGIAKGDIADFTKIALQMGSAFDMPADQAATMTSKVQAQFPKITQSASSFGMSFGSVVDTMGNNFAASEKEVLDFSMRTASSMSMLGGSVNDVAGFGGKLISTFPSAELAAGSFNSLVTNMTTNDKAIAEGSKLLGVTTDEYNKMMASDPTETILSVGAAMNKLPTEQQTPTAKIIGGGFGDDAIKRIANDTEGFKDALGDARIAAYGTFDPAIFEQSEDAQQNAADLVGLTTEEFQKQLAADPSKTYMDIGKALDKVDPSKLESVKGGLGIGKLSVEGSYDKSVQNLEAQLGILGNSAKAILIDMGGPMLGPITAGVSVLTSGLNVARGAGEALVGAFTNTSAFAQLESIGSTISSSIGSSISIISGSISQIGTSLNSAFGGDALGSFAEIITTPLSMSLGLVNQLLGLFGAMGNAAATGIGATLTAIASTIDMISSGLKTASAYLQAFGEVTGITDAFNSAKKSIEDIIEKISEIGSKISSGLTTAIPTAINGLQGALASLASQFGALLTNAITGPLAGVADAMGLSGVSSKLNEISTRANEILTPTIADSVETGLGEGADKGAKNAADTIGAEVETAVEDAIWKGSSGKGLQVSGGQILGGADHTSTYIDPGTKYAFSTILANYTAQHFTGEAISIGGMYKIWDEAGDLIAENVLDLGKWKAEMQPIVQDFEKYFRKASSNIKDTLSSAVEDGVIEPLEKTSIEGLISQLDELKSYDLEVYTKLDGESLRNDAINALANLPMSIDKSELELAFSKYIAENSSMYETIYQKTGIISYEDQERTLHNALKAAPEEAQSLYAELESAIKSGDLSSLSTIPAIMGEIADVSPELLVFTGTTNRLAAAQELYLDAWANARQGASEASANGDRTNGYFLRTSQTEEIAKVGLVSMAKDVYNSAVRMREANLYAAKGGELLFSPLTATFDNMGANVDELDQILPTTTDSAATLSAAFVDTTTNVSLANDAVSKFSAALGAATSSMASRSYSSAYYSPAATSTATLASSLNQNAKYSFLPLEYQLAYSKNIPKFATGAKVSEKTLAWIAESGETEYVIPESMIKGLYPEFAKATEGSMQWLTGEKYFSDYASPTIIPPTSYRWSSYPDAPQVQQLNTDKMPSAWLSEGQTSGADMISSEIRALQLASIGKSQVIPWFARGEMEQPDWWVDEATKLSPKYAANWAESKGGSVSEIVSDTPKISTKASTISDYWNGIYDNSGTCIAFVEPDPSLKFTPGTASKTALNRDAWNAVYDNEGTCIAFVEPDSSLKFTPSQSSLEEAARGAWGSQTVGSATTDRSVSSDIRAIRDNTNDNKKATEGLLASVDKASLQNAVDGVSNVQKTVSVTASRAGALVGLSEEGYVVSYDPRTDTCEGMPFNAPDPSLKTTDKFYLGLTKDSPAYKSYDEYGWEGKTGWTDDPALAQLQKINEESYKESQKTSESTEKTSENTQDMYRTLGQQYALQQKTLALGGATLDATGALVSLMGGTSGGLYGKTAGSFWGGLSIGGGGGSIGTGASMSGWGAQASNSATTTSSGGGYTINSGSVGSVQWAEGGITDHPVFGVFGEAGREAFVPISDRQAGLRILPQVMKELGVRQFASGGIVGSGGGLQNLSAAIGPTTITYAPVIQGSGLSEAALQRVLENERKKIFAEVSKKQVLAARRRG